MQQYNPYEVSISIGGKTFQGYSLEDAIRKPNITITDLADCPKDHPDYAENLVRVDVSTLKCDDGNSYTASFKMHKDSEGLKQIQELDPYDVDSLTGKGVI